MAKKCEQCGGVYAKAYERCPECAPQPSVPSGEAVAWAPQLVDGSMPLLVYASVDFRTVEQAVEHFIKPEHWRVIPLYAAPPQERVSEVTEAMVEAGLKAKDGYAVFGAVYGVGEREVMRRILTAALSAGREDV